MMPPIRTLLPVVLALIASSAWGQQEPAADAKPADTTRYWTTDWSFESIDIGKLTGRLARIGIEVPVKTDGEVSVNFTVSVPLSDLTDPQRYRLRGKLTSPRLVVDQLELRSLTTGVDFRDGVMTLDPVAARVTDTNFADDASAKIVASVRAQLTPLGEVKFDVSGDDVPLRTVARLGGGPAEWFDGKVDLKATGTGSLETRQITVAGQVATPGAVVFGQDLGMLEHDFALSPDRFTLTPISADAMATVNNVPLRSIETDYRWNENRFELTNLTAEVFSGSVNGNASIALADRGDHRIALTWSDLAPELSTEAILPVDVRVGAVTGGEIDWTVPADRLEDLSAHRGEARINLASLRIAGGDVGQGDLRLAAGADGWRLRGDGQLLGGTFEVDTVTPVDDATGLGAVAAPLFGTLLSRTNAKFSLRGARIADVSRLLRPDDARRFGGRVSLDVDLGGESDLGGRVTLDDVTLGRTRLTQRLAFDWRLSGRRLVVRRGAGVYAGGRIDATGEFDLGGGTSRMRLRLAGVDAGVALMPVFPTVAKLFDGDVSGNLSISAEDNVRFRGSLSARESWIVSAIPTGDVRGSIRGFVSTDLRRWRAHFESIDGRLARGRLRGELDLSSASAGPGTFNMASRWRASRVDFGEMLRQADAATSLAHGRITGDLSLGGRRVKGVSDLNGSFAARLSATEAAAIPGLVQVNKFLSAVSLPSTQFRDGIVSGVIGGGAARINEFVLTSDRVQVTANGRVGLRDGRMDVAARIATGNFGIGASRVVAGVVSYAAVEVLPLSALLEVNQLVNNQALHFDVLGPIGSPRVRIDPIKTIRQETPRFIFNHVILNGGVFDLFDD